MRYADALSILREAADRHSTMQKLPTETVTIANALGRICAQNVESEITLPPFTNSSVDGFAFANGATAKATIDSPLTFKIAGAIFPGEMPRSTTPLGHAWEIMTGGPLPLDCSACAKVEDTGLATADGMIENAKSVPLKTLTVTIRCPLEKNENVRFAGTDFDRGSRVISRGDRIRPEHLMALASVGRVKVEAFKKAKVLLIPTGKELVEPGTPLRPGEIYNSTRFYLKAALESLGADVEIAPTMLDEPGVFIEFMKQALSRPPDIILTTGAVSMGSADFVRPALEKLGARVLFHRVDIRPGRPLLFAEIQLPQTSVAVFGLPGNPVSGVVGLRFFIEAYLRARFSQKPEAAFRAKLATAFKKPKELRCFFKAQLVIDEGEAKVHLLAGQPSYMVRPLLRSSVWAVLREGIEDFAPGDLIEVFTQDSSPHDFSGGST